MEGHQIARLLDTLTEQALTLAPVLNAPRPGEHALPDDLLLANGQSAYQAPGGQLHATPKHVRSERILLTAAGTRDAAALDHAAAARFVTGLAETGIELGADQAAAVRGVLTSGARVESLVGPAGTGKSFVVGALAKAWTHPGLWENGEQRRVVGLAASQIATDVLTAEGVAARNITRWLATQQRLTDGTPAGDDHAWRLHEGDLVVVDESAMADTPALAAIHAYVEEAGAKLLLVGDHRQLAAIGAAGGMDLLASAGLSYELVEARRFTHPWERDASLRLRTADETVLVEYHAQGRLIDGGALEQAEASAARGWLADTLAGQRSLLLVDTNEQAARLSAALRADLVRLGRVAEAGVPLGLQGTWSGVGDLVQARRNGWELADYDGNRRGPINRETYRVLATRDDGGLVVAPILGHSPDGETLGDRMTLPGSYVTEHVALGYASTVHAAQGLTVDTAHAVITGNTGPEALYVGMSRGRHANTAHVATRAVPADAPPGAVQEAVHHTPAAVLAATLETAEPERSALAIATESAADAASVRTAAELFADGADLAATARTAAWFDQLVDTGALTPKQRAQLAAEDAAHTLGRTLRRAELAGHDPRHVLRAAVTERGLDQARQLANVLHHRIVNTWPLDPVADTYADWTPRVDDPQWRAYLDTLTRAADTRRLELAEAATFNPPDWALEAFGPPPRDSDERAEWQTRVGAVAAHRELTGHDDPLDPLGPPPKAGQVEAYASWRAGWRALGRPDAERDELELSDGQLRMRVRALRREEAWGPRYVGNELAATRQAADTHRRTAALRAAEATTTSNAERRAELQRGAEQATALADTLNQRAAELTEVEQARGAWLAHTAATRAAADRATAELTARGIDRDEPDDTTTAEQWLAAHQADQRAEDPHREITDEAELVDTIEQRATDFAAAGTSRATPAHADEQTAAADTAREADPPVVETAQPDLREVAAAEPAPTQEDTVQVPSAEQAADSVARAQRALAEIRARDAAEEREAAEQQRAEQLSRWHAQDQAAETEHTAERETLPVGIGDPDD